VNSIRDAPRRSNRKIEMWIEEMAVLSSYAESTYQQTTIVEPGGHEADRRSSLSTLPESEHGDEPMVDGDHGTKPRPRPLSMDRMDTRLGDIPRPSLPPTKPVKREDKQIESSAAAIAPTPANIAPTTSVLTPSSIPTTIQKSSGSFGQMVERKFNAALVPDNWDFNRQRFERPSVSRAATPEQKGQASIEHRRKSFMGIMGLKSNGKSQKANIAAPMPPQVEPLSFRGIEDFAEEVKLVADRVLPDTELILTSSRLRDGGLSSHSAYLIINCTHRVDGDLPEIKERVLQGADPNCRINEEGTHQLLEMVLVKPSTNDFRKLAPVEWVITLLQCGANPNFHFFSNTNPLDYYYSPALLRAAYLADEQAVWALRAAGADPNGYACPLCATETVPRHLPRTVKHIQGDEFEFFFYTPLLCALALQRSLSSDDEVQRRIRIVRFLLVNGAELQARRCPNTSKSKDHVVQSAIDFAMATWGENAPEWAQKKLLDILRSHQRASKTPLMGRLASSLSLKSVSIRGG
jgi:hypothetical protein